MRVASWPMAADGIWRSISTITVDSYTGVRRAEMMMVDATQLRTKPRIFRGGGGGFTDKGRGGRQTDRAARRRNRTTRAGRLGWGMEGFFVQACGSPRMNAIQRELINEGHRWPPRQRHLLKSKPFPGRPGSY